MINIILWLKIKIPKEKEDINKYRKKEFIKKEERKKDIGSRDKDKRKI